MKIRHTIIAAFALLMGAAPAFAAPVFIDAKTGGTVTITLPALPASAQLALIPTTPYVKFRSALNVTALATDERFIYTATDKGRLQIFENLPDAPPRRVGEANNLPGVTRIAVHGTRVYLSGGNILYALDVQKPEMPKLVARLALPASPELLAADEGRLYWVGNSQLNALDAHDIKHLQPVAELALDFPVAALAASGGFVYLAEPGKGVAILDARASGIREAARFSGDVADIAVSNGIAYLANGATGLTLLDVENPEFPGWMGSINRIGRITALRQSGSYLLLANDRHDLILADARNPKLPKIAAQYSKAGQGPFALMQKTALLGTHDSLESIDFSMTTPNVASSGVNFGGSRRGVIRDNILYVADWFSGLHLYDIHDPNSPKHLANYHTQGSSKGVLVRDNVAFVADDDHGVQILDVSHPETPRKISEVATPGLAYTMKLAGDALYLADHRGGFHIISVKDINHPYILGSVLTPGKAWAVEVLGDLAFVAADAAGLMVYDIKDPQNIKEVAAYDTGGAAEDVVIRDNLAYVASFDSGLYIYDISDPLKARQVSHLPTPANARGIELVGNLAYIADWVSGLQIVNIEDPRKPYIAGSYDTIGWSWGVRVEGHYAYVLDWWGGVTVLDVADPAAPVLAGAYHARGITQDVAVQDSYAYVADGVNGLQVFDIKNPLNPIWMTGIDTPGNTQGVWIEGKMAYLASGAGGILAVDIHDPFTLKRAKHFDTEADLIRAHSCYVYAIKRHEGVVILNANNGKEVRRLALDVNDAWPVEDDLLIATPTGIEIVNLTRPDNPQLKLLPLSAELIRGDGNLLALYDKSDLALYEPETLKLLGRINLRDEISDFKISGNFIYALGKNSGLISVDISDVHKPVLAALYPAQGARLGASNDAVFLAGGEALSEIKLLPPYTLTRDKRGKAALTLPPNTPPGSYSLVAKDPKTGKETYLHDALRVAFSPSNKPRFTLKDLEREMKKRGLTPSMHQ